MASDTWFAFVAASVAFLMIPVGPTILLVITFALSNGPRIAPAAAFGVALGDMTAMTVSLTGLGALALASAYVFVALKWIGAIYLIWFGIRTIRSARSIDTESTTIRTHTPTGQVFRQCFGVTALNPKPIIFYIAFVPHFIDPATSLLPQFSVAIATLTSLAWLNAYLYARFAGQLSESIQRPAIMIWIKRVSGTILISMGLTTLALRRSTT